MRPASFARTVNLGRRQISAVLFDLGDTLVDQRDFSGWCELGRPFGLLLDPDRLSHSYLEVEQEMDADPSRLPRERAIVEFWRRTLSRAVEGSVPEGVAREFSATVRSTERPRLFSDVRRCLDQLSEERRLLGVVSNSISEERVRGILERVGILDYFSGVVSSGTEGVEKPDPEIFRRTVTRLGVRPDAALYVGNLAHTDAKAAIAAGLHAVWLNRYGFGYGEDPPEITSLLEVPIWIAHLEEGT